MTGHHSSGLREAVKDRAGEQRGEEVAASLRRPEIMIIIIIITIILIMIIIIINMPFIVICLSIRFKRNVMFTSKIFVFQRHLLRLPCWHFGQPANLVAIVVMVIVGIDMMIMLQL